MSTSAKLPGLRNLPRAARWLATLGALVIGAGLAAGVTTTASAGARDSSSSEATPQRWVATWSAAMQAPSPDTIPLELAPNNPEVSGFAQQTVRNIVSTSIGGSVIRIHFSNAFGRQPLKIGATTVGEQLAGAQLVPGILQRLTFNGSPSVAIPAGGEVASDPVHLDVRPFENLAVSVYLPEATGPTTYHAFSQETNFFASGDQTQEQGTGGYRAFDLSTRFPLGGTSWYYVSGIDVRTTSHAVVALGDSITDGYHSQIGANDRWPNQLAKRLAGALGVLAPAVVDEGISGNRVLTDSPCLGQSALNRFDRDVRSVPGARDVILFEGGNDISVAQATSGTSCWPQHDISAQDIISGYEQLITTAHANGLRIFGATITPTGKSPLDPKEIMRGQVNHWIRTIGRSQFDGVFDMDGAVRSPDAPLYLQPAYNGDGTHASDAGYQAMASAVDLAFLTPGTRER